MRAMQHNQPSKHLAAAIEAVNDRTRQTGDGLHALNLLAVLAAQSQELLCFKLKFASCGCCAAVLQVDKRAWPPWRDARSAAAAALTDKMTNHYRICS